jgi:hypothetical protein
MRRAIVTAWEKRMFGHFLVLLLSTNTFAEGGQTAPAPTVGTRPTSPQKTLASLVGQKATLRGTYNCGKFADYVASEYGQVYLFGKFGEGLAKPLYGKQVAVVGTIAYSPPWDPNRGPPDAAARPNAIRMSPVPGYYFINSPRLSLVEP